MKKCTIHVRDEVWCTISGLNPADHEYLFDKFSLMVEGARWMPAVRLGRWDGRIPFFSKEGKIYTRLLDEVLPFLDAWGYEIDFLEDKIAPPVVETRIDKNWFLQKPEVELKVELRPYQVSAVNACLDAQSGFIVAATSSGKTWMVAALADVMALNELKTIVIVPSADLVEQTVATFRLGKLDVGIYSGATKDIYHSTVVATWQALQNNPSLMNEFQCVIVDEAHGAKAQTVGELINVHGKNIAFRFGFTGTMPKPEIDAKTLKGAIGEVLFSITAKELMDMGYVAQLEIEPVELEEDVPEEFPDYASEKAFLAKSPARLDFLADLIIAKAEQHGNTFVLVNSIKQGKALQKLIKDSVFLHGADDTDVRAEWYSMFENRDNLIVIATFGIASTGISIDRIFVLFMVDAGKGFIRSIQSVGRSLRKGRDKDSVLCIDVHSKLKWSKKHFRERQKWFKEAKYTINKLVKYKL